MEGVNLSKLDDPAYYCPVVLTHGSHTSALIGRIPLPRLPISELTLMANYTVTDAGISAGENFAGLTNKLVVVADGNVLFEVRRNELAEMLYLTHGREGVTGNSSDPDPTTATAQDVFYTWKFRHDLSRYREVYLELTTEVPTTEWGGASAFTCEVRAAVKVDPSAGGKGDVFLRKVTTASSTEHSLDIPGWVDVDGVFVSLSTGTPAQVLVSDDSGKRDLDLAAALQARSGSFYYAEHTVQSVSATKALYLVQSAAKIGARTRTGRKAVVTMSTAGTISLAFIIGQVNWSNVPRY